MEINSRVENNITIVALKDELDFFNSSKFKEYFAKLFATTTKGFIIDFQQVSYIDSSGIGALLGVFKQSKVKQTALYFVNIHGSVRKVIELTKLDAYFPIRQSLDDALRAIQ